MGLVLREQLRQEAYSCSPPLDGFRGEVSARAPQGAGSFFRSTADGLLQWSIVQSGIREVEVHVLGLHHWIVYD